MFVYTDYTPPSEDRLGRVPGAPLSDDVVQELVQNIMLLAVGPEHSRRLRAGLLPEVPSPRPE